MVATESTMQALGSQAADFSLPDVSNADQTVSLSALSGKPLLLMFICNHCPFVIHIIRPLVMLANEYQRHGFAVVAISANDIQNYPQDAPDKMVEFAQAHGFEFPYCYDESQQTALAYGAACTPDFFVYDANHQLRYRGQMDASRPGNSIPVTGFDLRAALQAVIDGKPVSPDQHPSIGCNIKWKT